MKSIFSILGLSLFTIGSSVAGITLSTTAIVGMKDNTGAANIPVGAVVLLIVDNGSNGFLNLSTNGAITPGSAALTSSSDPKVNVSNASITAGQTFGGDYILQTYTAASGGSLVPSLTDYSIAGYENKRFALVWFTKTAGNLAGGLANEYFGIASGDDWALPSTDAGAYTFHPTTNTTTSVYWQLASSTTAAQIGTSGFFTGSGSAGSGAVKSATFQIVPEPSAVLLAALGSLGLLRRRRN